MEIRGKSVTASFVSIEADETTTQKNVSEANQSAEGIFQTVDSVENSSVEPSTNNFFQEFANASPDEFSVATLISSDTVPEPAAAPPPVLPDIQTVINDPDLLANMLQESMSKYDLVAVASAFLPIVADSLYSQLTSAPLDTQIAALKNLEQSGTPPNTTFDKLFNFLYTHGEQDKIADYISLLAKNAAANPDAGALIAHIYNDIKA